MATTARRLGQGLLLVVNLLAATVAAAAWVAASLRPGTLGLNLDATGVKWPGCIAALLLLLGNLLWLVRRGPKPEADFIESATDSGPVRVAREALVLGLRHAGESVAEVTRFRVEVRTGRGSRVLVRGSFHCAEGASNLIVGQRLRQALRDRFDAMVRPVDGSKPEFELVFAGFHGKLSATASDAADAVTFTGPQYPIDDDDKGRD
jgi:hypothetical protein